MWCLFYCSYVQFCGSFWLVYKKTDEWYIEWQQVVQWIKTSENECFNQWQVVTAGENEWQQVTMSDKE